MISITKNRPAPARPPQSADASKLRESQTVSREVHQDYLDPDDNPTDLPMRVTGNERYKYGRRIRTQNNMTTFLEERAMLFLVAERLNLGLNKTLAALLRYYITKEGIGQECDIYTEKWIAAWRRRPPSRRSKG